MSGPSLSANSVKWLAWGFPASCRIAGVRKREEIVGGSLNTGLSCQRSLYKFHVQFSRHVFASQSLSGTFLRNRNVPHPSSQRSFIVSEQPNPFTEDWCVADYVLLTLYLESLHSSLWVKDKKIEGLGHRNLTGAPTWWIVSKILGSALHRRVERKGEMV